MEQTENSRQILKVNKITYKNPNMKNSIKINSRSWSYLISGWLLSLIGIMDYILLGHMIGHPGEQSTGEYVGQGIAVFLGGISFFYTVGLIPLIVGVILIIYSYLNSKIVEISKTEKILKIKEQRLLFPTYSELDLSKIKKIDYQNLGLKLKHAWILLFIPMAVRILQFGIPIFGEHRAIDEILPVMMVLTAIIDISAVIIILLFPNQKITFHSNERIYSLIFSPITYNKTVIKEIQDLFEFNNEIKDGNSNSYSRINQKYLFQTIFGTVLLILGFIGATFEIFWSTDLSMVGITYGFWLIIKSLKFDFSDETRLSIGKNSKILNYSHSLWKFFDYSKYYSSKSEIILEPKQKLRKINLVDIVGLGFLIYLSTIEFIWSWSFLNIFNGLILFDIIVTSIVWCIIIFAGFVYFILPVDILQANQKFSGLTFKIYNQKIQWFPTEKIKKLKNINKFIKNSELKREIIIRIAILVSVILTALIIGLVSII